VRVIAGTHRGRPLQAPKGSQTRPTSDKVREAIFSILQDVSELAVLDLFAGSGALGIEALSRGAGSASFVDNSAGAIRTVKANLSDLNLSATVVQLPALRALTCTPIAADNYDLVFIDPPYRLASGLGPELSNALPPLLSADARVVTESDRRSPLALSLPLSRERQYGDTLIRIYGT
jgi:16S rRNA (guanine966-N2)-methyltransferase